MPPKKPAAGSPAKKKGKDHHRLSQVNDGSTGDSRTDTPAGNGQDNDDIDAYHEPVEYIVLDRSL